MNGTRSDFCRTLLDERWQDDLDPETMAARFVRYFDVPARPTMAQLTALLKKAGFGRVSGSGRMDAKGIHYSTPGGGYDIHYREDMWEGTQAYSVLHETYEIVHETLHDMNSDSPSDRAVCVEAERFAAAVLMQPQVFRPLALEWGLDVPKLQRAFQCSYPSVTIRLAEVLHDLPFMAILYARDGKGGPERPEMRVKAARGTGGFGARIGTSISGDRGGVPRWGRGLPAGSLAAQAARYGTTQYTLDGGYAVLARPVIRQRKLTRVVVVAVPEAFASILEPQLADSSTHRWKCWPVAAAEVGTGSR